MLKIFHSAKMTMASTEYITDEENSPPPPPPPPKKIIIIKKKTKGRGMKSSGPLYLAVTERPKF